MPDSATPTNYRLGSLYSLTTAFLYATQEPFSFLAARHLTTLQFVCLTQIALLISIPLVTWRPSSRRDLVALLSAPSNYGKLAVIFAIGMTGLLLYNFGLSNAHPIIISAILNLSPFWAAMVALLIMRVPIPVSPATFFGCFAGAFIGAMAVAWSQLGGASKLAFGELAESFLHGSWVYAIPVPLCSALGGTLIGKWLSRYEESAAVAANFFVANVILIPSTVFILYQRSELAVRRSVPCDRAHDCRHDHRRICGPRVLSDRLDSHRRRQRLRHDVPQLGSGADGSDIAGAVVVDRRLAFCRRSLVLCWLGAHRGVAAAVFAEGLAAAAAAGVRASQLVRVSIIEGRRYSLTPCGGGLGRGVAPLFRCEARGPLFAGPGATPHPCLPPQGGKENACSSAAARPQI